MTKVDVFSGFLGAGKTTLIKKLIAEAYAGEKLVLIENEFGEVGVDGGFMQEAGIEVTEMSQGCICCSLVGDFAEALKQVLSTYAPDRILIEPSGVGKLSDVIRAVQGIGSDEIVLNSFTAVVDAKKCKVYMKNFGEFYNDQVENASCIVLSRTAGMDEKKLAACVELIRQHNTTATIVTTDWDAIGGAQILEAMEQKNTLAAELERLAHEHEHHHHHHHEDGECCCGHHHDEEHEHHHHEDGECCCGHNHDEEHEHHHHEDGECTCGHHHDEEHEHHHHEDGECTCGHHHDEHEHHHHHEDGTCSCGHDHHHDHHDHDHHHHHADEVFVSFGAETAHKYTEQQISDILDQLSDAVTYGIVLRAKGIVAAEEGEWIHFDYVPGEKDIRRGAAQVTGRLCVIGSALVEDELREVFCL
ncbi:MAG: GTP-binding protein [Clostridia bacterium]|nr:GTP-binding protein [Clostridia bacterium]